MSTRPLLSGLLLVAVLCFTTTVCQGAPVPVDKPSTDAAQEPLPDGCLLCLGSTRLRHDSPIRSIAFSPDGKYLVSASEYGSVRLWAMPGGRPVRSFAFPDRIFAIAISTEANLVAVGGKGGVQLWELSTGKIGKFIAMEMAEVVYSLAFSAEGNWLFGGGREKVWKWELPAGRELAKQSMPFYVFNSLAVAPDGDTLLAGTNTGEVLLLDVNGKKKPRFLRSYGGGSTREVAFSSDGELVSACSTNLSVQVWRVKTGLEAVTLRGAPTDIRSIAFGKDGKTIVGGGSDRTVRAWDTDTGKVLWENKNHKGAVFSVAVSPDGNTIASAGSDCVIRLCDATTGKAIDPPTGHGHSVTRVCFSPDGRYVASGGEDATVRLWSARSGKELRVFPVVSRCVDGLAFSPDGKQLVACGGSLCMWDVEAGQLLSVPAKLPKDVAAFAFSQDGKQLAAADEGYGGIVLVGVHDDRPAITLRAGKQHAGSLAFSPDGSTLIAGYGSGAVRFWETATGKELRAFPEQSLRARVAVSASGLVAASGGERVALWSLLEQQPIGSVEGGYTDGLAFSPNGAFLLRTEASNTLRCYEPLTGGTRFVFKAEQRIFFDVAVSPDGKHFAAACSNGTVLIGSLLYAKGKPTPTPPRPADLQKWWTELADRDAAIAHTAYCHLCATAEQSVPFLRSQLKPAAVVPEKHLAKLLEQLDDDEFARREAAALELRALGERAATALRAALKRPRSVEFRRRAGEILELMAEDKVPTETLRVLRASALLEQLATAEAKQTLRQLGDGDPLAEQTRAAQGAFARLDSRKPRASEMP